MKVAKTLTGLLFSVVLLCMFAFQILAKQPIQPRWQDTVSVSVVLSFRGNTAYCTATVQGTSNVSKMEGTMRLKDSEGNTLKTWSISSNGPDLFTSKTYSGVQAGKEYTLSVSVDVTGSATETVSDSITKRC